MVIWKYKMALEHSQFGNFDMPKGAEILEVHEQDGWMCLWALVDSSNELERRAFVTYGTGYHIAAIDGNSGETKYIGTAHFENAIARLVFHVFELCAPEE